MRSGQHQRATGSPEKASTIVSMVAGASAGVAAFTMTAIGRPGRKDS